MIPRENTDRLLNALPVKTPNSPVIAFPLVSRPAARASRFTPGRGTWHPSRYRAMSTAVTISFRRSSGTLQAFPSALIMLSPQYLDASAGRLYLFLRRFREGVRPDNDSAPNLSVPQYLNWNFLLPDEPSSLKLLDADLILGESREFSEVNRRVNRRSCRSMWTACHTLQARQPALQGHLTTLVGQVGLRTRASLGPLVTATAGLPKPRAGAAPEPLA